LDLLKYVMHAGGHRGKSGVSADPPTPTFSEFIQAHFMTQKSSNSVWHHTTVTRQRREQQNGHLTAVVCFTDLSGSGKSTFAHAVEESLHQAGCRKSYLRSFPLHMGAALNLH
jgi:hypothetical protein